MRCFSVVVAAAVLSRLLPAWTNDVRDLSWVNSQSVPIETESKPGTTQLGDGALVSALRKEQNKQTYDIFKKGTNNQLVEEFFGSLVLCI